jgi:hypothetical protein
VNPDDLAQAARRLVAQRVEQGLPETCSDPSTIARIAGILREPPGPQRSPDKKEGLLAIPKSSPTHEVWPNSTTTRRVRAIAAALTAPAKSSLLRGTNGHPIRSRTSAGS